MSSTDSPHPPSRRSGQPFWRRPDVAFVIRALLWIVVIFGTLRLSIVERGLLLPLAAVQAQIAFFLTDAPADAVAVDRSCTAADALALCLGTILAFPAPWRRRVLGAALGFLILQIANIARIGHLALAVERADLFRRLHLVVWPAVLVLLAVVYVALWMRRAGDGVREAAVERQASPRTWRPWRFLGLAAAFVAAYYALYPWLLVNPLLTAVADFAASTAGALMRLLGATAGVEDRILRTAHGAWIVTPECVITPLIPLFLAAVLASRRRGWQRLAAAASAIPIFLFLAVARLLVLAIPAALVGSHQVAVHAFYQFLVAVAVVALSAHRGGRRIGVTLAAGAGVTVAAGVVDLRLLAPTLAGLSSALHLGHGWIDTQGALNIGLAVSAGLFAGIVIGLGLGGLRRIAAGLAILVAVQILVRAGLGELATHFVAGFPVAAIRAWALAVPIVLAWLLVRRDLAARTGLEFWQGVGGAFPDLGGAASTALYRHDEQRLVTDHLAPLHGKRLLKTDLWDEAKNSRILCWAAEQGVEAWGIDISLPTLRAARRETATRAQILRAVVADARALPFADESFDLGYSMGTVEHFPETDAAVEEIYRVMRRGGRAIVGVPNRRDIFLRPVLVAVLDFFGLYAYGLEKSYSRPALRDLCRAAGFEIVAETGILFLPGALRMLDLLFWTRARPLARITALLVAPFSWLSRRMPRLSRHGYLIAAVLTRPARSASQR